MCYELRASRTNVCQLGLDVDDVTDEVVYAVRLAGPVQRRGVDLGVPHQHVHHVLHDQFVGVQYLYGKDGR